MQCQKYIRRADALAVYGLSARQVKRWLSEKRIRCYHPAGERGPCFLKVSEQTRSSSAPTDCHPGLRCCDPPLSGVAPQNSGSHQQRRK